MRLRHVVDVSDRDGEWRRNVLTPDGCKGVVVGAFVEILRFQGQFVAAEDD